MPNLLNLLAKIEYEGTRYHGWQSQPQVQTVEGEIRKALNVIFQSDVEMRACSRTDAGVHARCQLANIRIPAGKDLVLLRNSLNSLLPKDICIIDLAEVSLDYQVKNENRGKQYVYQINNSRIRKGLDRNIFWWVKAELSLENMRRAAADFVGKHDFKAYQGTGCTQIYTEKEIHTIEVLQNLNYGYREIRIVVSGSGFLRNMVRIMVGTLVDIGRGRLPVNAVAESLQVKNRKDAGLTAPPHGLFLNEIFLNPNPFKNPNNNPFNNSPE